MIAEVSSHWPYVGAAWAITGGLLGGYTIWVLRQGRRLGRRVPEGKRRWM